jgi:hypothetical protein
MPWFSTTPFYIWLVSSLVLAAGLWFWRPKSSSVATLVAINFVLYQVFWLLSLNWVIPVYYLRILPLILMFALPLRLARRLRPNFILGRPATPLWPARKPLSLAVTVVNVILLLVFAYVNVRVLLSYYYTAGENSPALLFFPVKDGMYFIANGGNGDLGWGMNNYVHPWPGSENPSDPRLLYAVDIFKSNTAGSILAPVRLGTMTDYEGFRDVIYNPCPGTIVKVENTHPDVIPPAQGETLLGNYVVMQCNQYYITIGGFKKDSILVKEGDFVRYNVMLGQVGNSGIPSIPHVHVHANIMGITGDPVPMLFDGLFSVNQFAVRNKIFIP